MIQKSTYEAPKTEMTMISLNKELLSLSDGNSQATNVVALTEGEIFDGAAW